MGKLTCTKDLHKSTYKGNAFDEGKEYQTLKLGDEFIWIKDNQGNEFSFSNKPEFPYYFIGDYFNIGLNE